MKTQILLALGIAISLMAMDMQVLQAQNEDVSSTLEVYKIIQEAGGETAEPVSEVTPGDTLQYRLTYTNNLSEPISNLRPVLPVPAGMQYLGTAEPALEAASLDGSGTTFQSVPITRMVTLQNGEQQERDVPFEEYRWLQWTVPQLQAQGSVTLRARVKVIEPVSLN